MMLAPLLGVIVLATAPAWDVGPHGGKLLVVDAKFLSVTAFDATTGKRAWTTRIEKEANGRHTLLVDGADPLAWFGEQLVTLDAATGAIKSRGTRGYNGAEWRDGGCWIDIADNVCAQRCQCSFQVFECATNKSVGPVYQKTYMELIETDENGGRDGMSAGCWGGSDALFGRAANIALVTAEDASKAKGKRRGDDITVGIDMKTGAEVWRRPHGAQFGGHSPDGKTSWFYGFTEALVAVDSATGRTLWTSSSVPAIGQHVVTFVAATGPRKAGIFDLRMPARAAGVAELRDERTGKIRWATKLPANTIAWTRGAPLTLLTGIGDATSIAILDPATGAIVNAIAIAKGSTYVPDGAGFVVGDPSAIIAYDASGTETGRVAISGGLHIGSTLVVVSLAKELVILDRGTLRERGRFAGSFNSVHVEGALGMQRIAAHAYDAKTIGTVTLLRVD